MSCLTCATVALVTETATEEDRYHWIVMFNENDSKGVYTYKYRSVPYMTAVVKKFHDEHNRYPYRIWVIVDGNVQKVEITS